MTLDDLGNVGDFIAAIAVVVSLIYVAIQVRQNPRIVKAATHHSSSRAWSELERALGADPETVRTLLKGGRNYAELDLEERFRYSLLMRAILHLHEDDFVQTQEGLIDAKRSERYRRSLEKALAEPAARAWWAENADLFSEEFQEQVARRPRRRCWPQLSALSVKRHRNKIVEIRNDRVRTSRLYSLDDEQFPICADHLFLNRDGVCSSSFYGRH